MAPKGSRQKRKSVGSSSTLFNAGMMPLLRKAADAVGKNIDVPGKLWGNCPAADKNKLFNCAVLEYAPMHKWEEAMPVYVSSAYFCLMMGEKDGAQIDAGDQFWLKADNEFLKYYYSANPLAEDSAREGAPPADEAQDPLVVDTSTPDNKNTTIAFDYVTKVSSFLRGGKVVTIYSCNCVLDAVGLHPIKCCGKITCSGRSTSNIFKHYKERAQGGRSGAGPKCDKHAAIYLILSKSSCRQVTLPHPPAHLTAAPVCSGLLVDEVFA